MSSDEQGVCILNHICNPASSKVTSIILCRHLNYNNYKGHCRSNLSVSCTVQEFVLNLIVSTWVVYWSVRLSLCSSSDMCEKRLSGIPFLLPATSQQTQCLQDTWVPHKFFTGTFTRHKLSCCRASFWFCWSCTMQTGYQYLPSSVEGTPDFSLDYSLNFNKPHLCLHSKRQT